MQLVAYGAQDIYLTGNPQITFFKVVYRRHTNFSMESIPQTFNGPLKYNSKVSTTISRNGDLIGNTYFQFDPSKLITTSGSNTAACYIGNTLIKEVEILIGGQSIDKHYGHWLTVHNELTEPNNCGNIDELNSVLGAEADVVTKGQSTKYQIMSYNHEGKANSGDTSQAPKCAMVPLRFWYCRNPGLALPLIALQYHEVKIDITFCALTDLNASATAGSLDNSALYVDYIYLDTDERRRFAQVSHEYLIEQLQFTQYVKSKNFDLNFNHPVKEIIWTGAPSSTIADTLSSISTPTADSDTMLNNVDIDVKWGLKLNGHDRYQPRHPNYFARTQVWQNHTGFGGIAVNNSILVYSFALKPEEHQPSGTCNFSRIDNALLTCTKETNDSINVYAVNYNVLRIMSGMGGLAYSN